MNNLAIYTAVAGGYDRVQMPHLGLHDVDLIAFVDDPKDAPGWQTRPLPDEAGSMSNRMRAKRVKLLPHRYLSEYMWTIWIDGNHRILTPELPEAMAAWAGQSGMALHRHPFRDCIYDEAAASVVMPKYAGQPIAAQIEHYRSEGHPEHWGLWAGGSIVRRNLAEDSAVRDVNEAWWAECWEWSYQDQISLPVVLRRLGMAPGTFPHNQYRSPWLGISGHPREHE